MKTLVSYEFLKILRRRSTVIVMAVSLLLTAFLFGLPILQYQTYHADGVIKGLDGIAYTKAQYSQISLLLTDEYVEDAVSEVQQLFANPSNVGFDGTDTFLIGDAYWSGIAPREALLNWIAATYAAPGVTAWYTSLPELDITNGANFYEAREEKIAALLNDPSRDLSYEQKEYWQSLNRQVETPLQYGYYEGWSTVSSCFELLMFSLLAVCLVLAPVFAGEYQAGTDAVILSGKYGKTKLITAKIAASYLFGLLAFTVHVLAAFGLPLSAFGVDGWDLPMQIANTTIPYPFTFLQGILVNLGVTYLVLFAMIGLTLLLSAKMKSAYSVLTVLVPVLFIPMFLSANGTTGLYNLTLFLLPYHAVQPKFGSYISYQFGSLVLDAFSARAILYAALTVMMISPAKRGFRRHQVAK